MSAIVHGIIGALALLFCQWALERYRVFRARRAMRIPPSHDREPLDILIDVAASGTGPNVKCALVVLCAEFKLPPADNAHDEGCPTAAVPFEISKCGCGPKPPEEAK